MMVTLHWTPLMGRSIALNYPLSIDSYKLFYEMMQQKAPQPARSCSQNFKVWIQRVGLMCYMVLLACWLIGTLGGLSLHKLVWLIPDLFVNVAMQVQLELKGTGNSSAKKASGGTGKGASASAQKGAQTAKAPAKRKSWRNIRLHVFFWGHDLEELYMNPTFM